MVVVVVEEEEAHIEPDHEVTRRRTQRRRAPRLRRAWRRAGTGRWGWGWGRSGAVGRAGLHRIGMTGCCGGSFL